MTSLNKGYGFMDGTTPEKMVDASDAISKRLANRAARTKVTGNTSLQAALVMLPSPDLEAMLNVFRSVAGQIETLLLERQLVEVGFDAVKVSLDKPRIATIQEAPAAFQKFDTKSALREAGTKAQLS